MNKGNRELEEYLLGDTINEVLGIITQNSVFSPVDVYLMGIENYSIDPPPQKHLQILPEKPTEIENGDAITHWVTFYFDGNIIHVYDSLNLRYVSPEQQRFFAHLLGQNYTFEYHHVHQQPNLMDCGVYALAFASAICFDLQPENQKFDESKMRSHVLKLMHEKVSLPFPTATTRGRPKKPKNMGTPVKFELNEVNIFKKRGRPKKEVELANLEENEVKILKKRGRPKKIVQIEENIKPSKKKGRPKKEIESKQDIKVLKKRGRPEKKIETQDNISHEITKPVGRPKKNKTEITKYTLKKTTLNESYKCPNCNSQLFVEESSRIMWCCGNGRINNKLPELNALFYKNPEFLSHVRGYNNLFAFSAIGVSEGFQMQMSGPALVKIQGRIYHRVFDLNYKGSTNNSSLYIDDGKERLKIAQKIKLKPKIVQEILQYLKLVNPFISSLKQLHQEDSQHAHLVFEKTTRKTHGPVLGDQPTCAEIAGVIYTTPDADPRKVVIWKEKERNPQFVHFLDPAYESLQYPLLFPHGSAGWSTEMKDNNNHKISQTKYYRYLLLSEPRFTCLDRLGQEYFVDMWCRAEEEKLLFIRLNQSKFLRMATRSEVDESIAAEGGPKAGKIYLPSSFTHGPRYMQLKYQDGMAIVARLGKPTFFITMTCNPNWPEIKANLNPKQSSVDRPDLCCRVFQLKLNHLLKILKSGQIFGKMVYILHVIEFQKRGLPHAHIALRVENSSLTHDEVDQFIQATIPKSDEPILQEQVLKHMVHGPCGLENESAPCMEDKKCSKKYPKPLLQCTFTDERGYVHYKRPDNTEAVVKTIHKFKKKNNSEGFQTKERKINNQWIVPYNPTLLMLFDCHINVEIASTVKIIKYLFKYIHKGPDMAKVKIVPDSDDQITDEIENYVQTRYLSASEAIWRLLEFDVSSREPTVNALPVHLPNKNILIFKEGEEKQAVEHSTSKLELYFDRPKTDEFKNLTYLELYEQYRDSGKRNSKSDHPRLIKRVRGECVARMHWLSPTLGEIYYLRLLLAKFPAYSYEDLRTKDGKLFQTFQEAAHAKGLLTDMNEYREAILEAAGFKTGHGLRILFFNLIISGAPSAILWEEFKTILAEDFLDKFHNHYDRAFNKALCHIDSMLRKHGKSCEEVGLPAAIDESKEIDREKMRWDKQKLENYLNHWVPLLNSNQKEIYDGILQSMSSNNTLRIFIDGAGGTGKTILLRCITAKLRYEGKIVLCTAYTGIAALNYDGGCTAHSMFKIPTENLDSHSTCNIFNRSQRADLIRNSNLIVWDEAPMAHRFNIECLNNTLQDLMNNKLPFGGKNIIFSGDFRQIPPVIKYGSKAEILQSSIKFSSIWQSLQIFKLTISQRSITDPDYSKFLLQLGEGRLEETTWGDQNAILLNFPNLKLHTSLNEMIEHIYPDEVLTEFSRMSKRCILSPTNKNINQINRIIIQQKIPGDEIYLYSADSALIEEKEKDTNGDLIHLCTDILNKLTEPGVPDHKITVKIGAICILIRNLNFEEGLVNGTKVVIKSVGRFIIEVFRPNNVDKTFLIPRINFKFAAGDTGIQVMRKQFPIKLAYAMTINKAQGETLDFAAIDLRDDVFTHGQLYVALSRVRSSKNICVLSTENKLCENGMFTANPVFKELFI